MTDLYPDEEGYIGDGAVIGFCRATAAIALHSAVQLHATGVSGVISVTAGAADGDGIGVALKEATAVGDRIPVCFYGVVKMVAGAVLAEGDMAKNDASATYVLPIDTLTHDEFELWRGVSGGATSTAWRLGMCLQAAAASGDEFLLLVGRLT